MTTSVLIDPSAFYDFQHTVWDFYRANRRDLPWRASPTPYCVLVSELMLQQTQVARVQSKFATFLRRFPSFADLSQASFGCVLHAWSGLGYSKRAKYLWECAKIVQCDYDSILPCDQSKLMALPGIGMNTAGAIMAYAFNEPSVFIETNIRTVYIHHFFANMSQPATDTEIRQLVAATVPVENPREWYWALMDYGSHLKATSGRRFK